MNKSNTVNFIRLQFHYQSDLPHLIPLEIVSDLIFSAVTLTARANNRGDPVHSCCISFSVMWIIVASAHFCLWGDRQRSVENSQHILANSHLAVLNVGKYCQHILIAFCASTSFNRPKVICQVFVLCKWHFILPGVVWALSIHGAPHLLGALLAL